MTTKINGTNTTASPAITGADTDTGVSFASDTVNISTGGTTRVTVDNNKLNVASTNNIAYALDGWSLAGKGDASDILFGGISGSQFDTLKFYTSGSERMRIDSNGKVGIGTTSPDQSLHVHKGSAGSIASTANSVLTLENSSDSILQFLSPNNVAQQIRFGDPEDNGAGYIDYNHGNNVLSFGVSGPEKMRILSDGHVCIGRTDATINTSNFGTSIGGGGIYVSRNVTGASHSFGAYGNQGNALVMGDGDLLNTNGSYGSLSDETLKQDIVDAASQWDDIKNIRVRKFRFKDNPKGPLQIGVVAQEIEKVSAGLVSDRYLDGKADSGEKVKSVKYSVLHMKAVKALQEAMARIETLEAKVAALEAA